jgi:hypothetical protein
MLVKNIGGYGGCCCDFVVDCGGFDGGRWRLRMNIEGS